MATTRTTTQVHFEGSAAGTAILQREIEERFAEVPLPGTGRTDRKDVSVEKQAFVCFETEPAGPLGARLRELWAAARDVELRRRLRDQQRGAVAVDLVAEDGTIFETASIGAPLDGGYASFSETWFPVSLPR